MSQSSKAQQPDLADLDWCWLGCDTLGRVAQFDAWPSSARDREAGLFPAWTAHIACDPGLLMRVVLGLPRGYARSVRAWPDVERDAPRLLTQPKQLDERATRGIDFLVELHTRVADLPIATLRMLTDPSVRSNIAKTDDSLNHAWIHASESWLRLHWEELGVARAWTPLVIQPSSLGGFDYAYAAEEGCYVCRAAPEGALLHLDDLPQNRRQEFLGVNLRFGPDAPFVPDERQFETLRVAMTTRRRWR